MHNIQQPYTKTISRKKELRNKERRLKKYKKKEKEKSVAMERKGWKYL